MKTVRFCMTLGLMFLAAVVPTGAPPEAREMAKPGEFLGLFYEDQTDKAEAVYFKLKSVSSTLEYTTDLDESRRVALRFPIAFVEHAIIQPKVYKGKNLVDLGPAVEFNGSSKRTLAMMACITISEKKKIRNKFTIFDSAETARAELARIESEFGLTARATSAPQVNFTSFRYDREDDELIDEVVWKIDGRNRDDEDDASSFPWKEDFPDDPDDDERLENVRMITVTPRKDGEDVESAMRTDRAPSGRYFVDVSYYTSGNPPKTRFKVRPTYGP